MRLGRSIAKRKMRNGENYTMIQIVKKRLLVCGFAFIACLVYQSALAETSSHKTTNKAKVLSSSQQFPLPKVTSIPAPNRILFIGNSFTYYNGGVEFHLKGLLNAAIPNTVVAQRYAFGGETLEGHYNQRKTLQVINNYLWDTVVVQGYSNEPIQHPDRFNEYAHKFHKKIKQRGANSVFYMTWAYEGKPEMTQPLRDAYVNIANNTDSLVVPVGLAWQEALTQQPSLALFSDGKHSTLAGTYLKSCVFFASLYKINPVGNEYTAGLSRQQAELLQRIAWKTVTDFYGWPEKKLVQR